MIMYFSAKIVTTPLEKAHIFLNSAFHNSLPFCALHYTLDWKMVEIYETGCSFTTQFFDI